MDIKPYAPGQEAKVREFNKRLRKRKVTYQFPESHLDTWLPRTGNRKIYRDGYLAIDDDFTVRGGYLLKHQDFLVGEEVRSIGNYQLPLSEGTINKAYNLLGISLLIDALRQQPLLFSLGMGGFDKPLPRLLKSTGWSLYAVPFYFKVIRPDRFFRNIAYLRQSRPKRIFVDTLAGTGLGWLGIKLINLVTGLKSFKGNPASTENVNRFGDWADELWRKCQSDFSFSAVRDKETLNILYPREDGRFIRLKVSVNSEPIGWAVLLNTAMSNHKQFGDMRVGSIADCLALRDRETEVMEVATSYLVRCGVDLIVSNQSHEMYGAGLRKCGFLRGPSNFIFAASKELTELLEPIDRTVLRMHVNRGDGDGLIHL